MSNEQLEKAVRDGELDVAAGTAWLWARSGLAGSVDTLFVDEAGQMSLANVLAVADATRIVMGRPGVEFSWQGSDEGEDVSGRGWAALNPEDWYANLLPWYHVLVER